jgi:dGTP triphosphohydrolase
MTVFFSAFLEVSKIKTQVIPLSKIDFVHTRLTHSFGSGTFRTVGKENN